MIRSHRTSRARWLAALAVLGLLASACGGGGDSGETAPDTGGGEAVVGGDAETAPEPAPATETAPPEEEDQGELTAPTDTVPPEPEVPEAEAEQPQFGGTLRVAVEAESDGLNPTANNFAVSAYIMTFPVVEPVAYWDVNGNWVPHLAESFTKVGDGSSWQLKLREGIRFHDGTELDADDVVATFSAQLTDPIVGLAVRPAYSVDGELKEDAIVKIDDYTVEYNPIRGYGAFPQFLTSQLGQVVSSEWLARRAEDPSLDQMPVGTGPYMIESRTQDEVTVLVKNPAYWAADTVDVYLDRIEIYPITDSVVAAERLIAGDIDVVVTSSSEAILTLRGGDGVRTIENLRSSEDFAMLNVEQPPFDDIRARQAITFATDRDAYISLIRQGTAPAADTMFHPDLVWHNPDVVQETNQPERAGPLVEAYCGDFPDNCTDGKINVELQYSGPSVIQTRIAELLIDSWEDYFNVTQDELLQDDHIVQVAIGQYNVVTWRQFGEPDPDNDVLWLECSSVGFISLNWPRDCDPERDALMFEQRASDDLDRRVEIWHQIQQNMRDSYTYIFFNHANWTVGARDNVRGICGQRGPDGDELFCNNQGRIWTQGIWLSQE